MKTMHGTPDSTRELGARPVSWRRTAGWAGVAGPVVFTTGFLVQEAFRRDEYDPVTEPVSALEAGPAGWVQQLNFVVFGLLTMVFAVGLHRGLRRGATGLAGPAMLFVSGVALVLAAVFPLREDAAGVTYDPGGHIIGGVMFFSTSAIGLILLSRRAAIDPHWRGVASYTLGAGVAAMAAFVVMGAFVMPDGAPLHDWAGLCQRAVIVLVLFPCRIVLATRLLRV
jgi:hypothetical membrane protein